MRTFDVAGVAEVRIDAAVRSICPFDLEVDESRLTVIYRPNGRCVEVAGLDDYLDGFAGREISHEELVVEVRVALTDVLSPCWLVVEDTSVYRERVTLTVRAGVRP